MSHTVTVSNWSANFKIIKRHFIVISLWCALTLKQCHDTWQILFEFWVNQRGWGVICSIFDLMCQCGIYLHFVCFQFVGIWCTVGSAFVISSSSQIKPVPIVNSRLHLYNSIRTTTKLQHTVSWDSMVRIEEYKSENETCSHSWDTNLWPQCNHSRQIFPIRSLFVVAEPCKSFGKTLIKGCGMICMTTKMETDASWKPWRIYCNKCPQVCAPDSFLSLKLCTTGGFSNGLCLLKTRKIKNKYICTYKKKKLLSWSSNVYNSLGLK